MTLWQAARDGNLKLVKKLLDEGVDIHYENDRALHWASQNGHLEMVSTLLDRGANIRAENDLALCRAIQNDHFEVVLMLLNRDTNIHTSSTAPWYARAYNRPKVTELLENYAVWKKYYGRWRGFLVMQWARKMLKIWFRPDMPGGVMAKRNIAKIQQHPKVRKYTDQG